MSQSHTKTSMPALTLGAIGVVYGDIGTSVLYSMKEVFNAGHVAFNPANIFGVLSLFVWTITIIVSVKYISLVLRADNKGEGGLIAMLALASNAVRHRPRLHSLILLVGIFGTCLFYGDGVITPSISVLSAVEGLTVVSPAMHGVVIPATLTILFVLFFAQKFGTKGIGKLFGPVMVLWFILIAGIGIYHIQHNVEILQAVNPLYAFDFIMTNPTLAFIILGAVVLCVTGGEALYADMGHFGKTPIRIAWFAIVMPALLLNYFGQGAFLLANPAGKANPFFLMIPEIMRIPMVVMATLATVIASQALISGAFSITKQVVQLGFLPRMRIIYTNVKEVGQIYIPAINWGLFIAIAFAVVMFKSSEALAAAYGIAVCTDMLITTILTYFVVRYAWKYPLYICFGVTSVFFVVDFLFWSSNLLKLFKGGWFPLMLGAIMFIIMITWRDGKNLVHIVHTTGQMGLKSFLDDLFGSFNTKKLQNALEATQAKLQAVSEDMQQQIGETSAELQKQHQVLQDQLIRQQKCQLLFENIKKIKGIAVFLVAEQDIVPVALKQNLKHNKCLHEYNVFVTVNTHETPWIGMNKRSDVTYLGHNCWKVVLNFGFKNDPDVPESLKHIQQFNLDFDPAKVSYFLSHEAVVASETVKGMALWREKLFAHMHRNAGTAAEFLKLPSNNVVEMGAKVEI
ncbi:MULTISPECIES: KUP/HAK/KT family potassium transporter [unclassified Moraxella]|uniref:KUP/HAK/KT family potassium transporter n=1 Tax=unclassified Moraxella TaxID=2685852 RepID=UPI003AF7679C